MLSIESELEKYSLDKSNSIVIGSGILNALKIRDSHDIDVIVEPETYNELEQTNMFQKEQAFGREILVRDLFEIGTAWNLTDLNKCFYFNDLCNESVIIDDTRYISLPFLLMVKKAWAKGTNPRPKDIKDIELIEDYLRSNSL